MLLRATDTTEEHDLFSIHTKKRKKYKRFLILQ